MTGACWDCKHWRGGTAGNGMHAVCRQVPDRRWVIAQPESGCAYWTEAPEEQKVRLRHRRPVPRDDSN